MGNRKKSRNSTLGNRIKELRELHKLTQIELGNKVYKTDSTIRAWESGKSEPDTETLILLCKLFNTSFEYLLGLNDNLVDNTTNRTKEHLFIAYRNADPITQKTIEKILDINLDQITNAQLINDMKKTAEEIKLPTKQK